MCRPTADSDMSADPKACPAHCLRKFISKDWRLFQSVRTSASEKKLSRYGESISISVDGVVRVQNIIGSTRQTDRPLNWSLISAVDHQRSGFRWRRLVDDWNREESRFFQTSVWRLPLSQESSMQQSLNDLCLCSLFSESWGKATYEPRWRVEMTILNQRRGDSDTEVGKCITDAWLQNRWKQSQVEQKKELFACSTHTELSVDGMWLHGTEDFPAITLVESKCEMDFKSLSAWALTLLMKACESHEKGVLSV